MYEKYKNSYKVTEKELVSLSVYNVGFQRCDSLYQWGPGIRDHYLIHYIISGKGFYKIGKRTYELQAADSILVYPNTEVVYYAAETDPWEYAWVGFTGSDASMILKATDFSPEKPIIRETPHGSDIHRQILHIYDARGNEFEHAEDIDAFNDLEEEDIEENKKAEEPKKKVYASVFMGWSLEDGKDTFIPQWKAGDAVRNLVAEDGGEITLYAVWDDCPWIQAQDLYYTLEQAQSGFISEEEILSHATATDREDGSPILPGTNPAPSDPEVFTSFTIPDYQAEEFTNLQHDFAASENLTVVDHVGNTYVKQIMVHVTDTTPKKLIQMDLTGGTRFINSKYYNISFEEGGLEDNSIWKVDPEYKAALESALNNIDHDTPVETYVFSKETIKQMKQYVETHGIGNSKEPDALNNFYNQFLAPNRK